MTALQSWPLLAALVLLPLFGHAESRFELQEAPARAGVREFVLVHHADANSTPTAAQASLRIATAEPSAILQSIRVVQRYQLARVPQRGTPRQDGDGHAALLLVGVKELQPGVAFAGEAEICRFQVPDRAQGSLFVEVEELRGGLRSWSGENLNPTSVRLAEVSLGND